MSSPTGLSGLEQRVLARWRKLPAATPAPVVVGFSGGGDSLALAAVLARIAKLAGISPLLVNVDHGWRPTSGVEQADAAALAQQLGLPFRGLRVPGDVTALHPGVGTEEAARRERYRLLAEAAGAAGGRVIALAHHQQDQAETVLLHLLRGAGLEGVAGMHEVRTLPIPWWTPGTPLLLWRPFLTETQAEVRAYAAGTRLSPINDPSNDDPAYRRNAIRAEALPVLERIVPGATAALGRFAGLAADDDDALNAIAARILAGATVDGELARSVVLAEPPAVQRRLVRQWVRQACPISTVTAERTGAMLWLLAEGEPGKLIEIGENCSVAATRTGLRLVRNEPPGAAGGGSGATLSE